MYEKEENNPEDKINSQALLKFPNCKDKQSERGTVIHKGLSVTFTVDLPIFTSQVTRKFILWRELLLYN